jgi:hypothetical protein
MSTRPATIAGEGEAGPTHGITRRAALRARGQGTT